MTYDPVDTDTDGVVEADVDNPSVSTEELDNVFYAAQFDGADGGEQIQNALDKADNESGTNGVIVGPLGPDSPSSAPESNVWTVSSTIDITGYDDTQLLGMGKPLLYLKDGAETDIIRCGQDTSSEITENVRIEGIRLNGNRSNNTTGGEVDLNGDGNTEIKGNVGIRPIRASGWVIEDVDFADFQRFGYCAKLTQGPMSVRHSESHNCGDDGYTVSNQFFNTKDPDDARHTFDNIHGYNNDDQGIEIEDGAQYVVIKDSKLRNNTKNGAVVKAHGPGSASSEKPAEHVTFDNVDFLNQDTGLTIFSSDVERGVDYTVSDCAFVGNNVDIKLGQPDASGLTDVDIAGTYHNGSGSAVKLLGTSVMRRLNIDISGNTHLSLANGAVKGASITADIDASGSQRGIYLNPLDGDFKDITITEETVVRNADENGLLIRGESGNVYENLAVSGTYKNNGQDTTAADTKRSGVYNWIDGGNVDNIQFRGVRCYDDQSTQTQTYGIYPAGGRNQFYSANLTGNAKGEWGSDPFNLMIVDGRGISNQGDPNSNGKWQGEEAYAERYNVVVEDNTNNDLYMAVGGSYVAIDTQ